MGLVRHFVVSGGWIVRHLVVAFKTAQRLMSRRGSAECLFPFYAAALATWRSESERFRTCSGYLGEVGASTATAGSELFTTVLGWFSALGFWDLFWAALGGCNARSINGLVMKYDLGAGLAFLGLRLMFEDDFIYLRL
ncbi:hypothetical protein J3F83DRAFT_602662 [Trichoderma novae-zelandiae]